MPHMHYALRTMNQIIVNADLGKATISRHIYGHFAEHLGRCIYGGFWVGEGTAIPNTRGMRDDIVAALRAVRIPNLRWPGGCFADEYHWMDGIGPRERRPTMINTHWGGVTENNHFGTHEFLDLCEQLGCEPYICGNLGSGTVQEMQQWVEYLTFDGISPMAGLRRGNGRAEPWHVKFWGVGNENWGCGGNMSAEQYADEYRRYQTYVRDFGDNRLYKIACGARTMPGLSASASRDTAGRVHLSLCNLNPNQNAEVTCEVRGMALGAIQGRVLTADRMNAHNTFDASEHVRPAAFEGVEIQDNQFTLTLPAKSVVVLELNEGDRS